MDKYRFQLCTFLRDAKNFYQMQHDFDTPTLLYLSSCTGLTTSNISKIMSGVQVPTLLNFLKLCDAFECRVIIEPLDVIKAFPHLESKQPINNQSND